MAADSAVSAGGPVELAALSRAALVDLILQLTQDLNAQRKRAETAESLLTSEREAAAKWREENDILKQKLLVAEDLLSTGAARRKQSVDSLALALSQPGSQLELPGSGNSSGGRISASGSSQSLASIEARRQQVTDRRSSFYSKPRWNDIVRKNRFLYVKISEVKDLPKAKLGIGEVFDTVGVYCIVLMDKNEVARTNKAVAKANIWNEEYNLDLPSNFEQLQVSVCMKGTMKAIFKDDVIAQVTLKKDLVLKDTLRHEEWYPLYHARGVHDVALGELQLSVTLTQRRSDSMVQLSIGLGAGRNLCTPSSEGDQSSDISAYVSFHILPDEELKSTKLSAVQSETTNPVFSETFSYSLTRPQVADGKLHVSVWNTNGAAKAKGDHEFLGQIILPLAEYLVASLEADDPAPFDIPHWYPLGGKGSDNPQSIPHSMASKLSLFSGSAKILKRSSTSSRIDKNDLGKLSKSQLSLANLVKVNSLPELAIQPTVHDFASARPEENTDCDNCGGPLRRVFMRCKVCGLVCHEHCLGSLMEDCATAGSIRLSFKYTEELVLPYGSYNSLMSLFCEPRVPVLVALGSVCEMERLQEISKSTIHIFTSQGSAVQYVNQLITEEVDATKDPNTIFRGNSLATKTIDYYMKVVGGQYLASVLKKPINDIYNEHKNCEMDSSRITDEKKRAAMDFTQNRKNLVGYVRKVTDAIFTSLDACPKALRDVFAHMQAEVSRKFPDEPNIRYMAVSGFIFLRFFGPALLGPKLFGLRDEHADAVVSRTLTLATKTLQNLASLCEFGQKEPYMIDLNSLINERKEAMMLFIDALANNRERTYDRMRAIEERIRKELHILEGVENMAKASDKKRKSALTKELTESQERIADLRKDLDSLRRIVEQLDAAPPSNQAEIDYIKKLSYDIDLELARLHHHIAAKRTAVIAALQGSEDPAWRQAAEPLSSVLDELEEMRTRLSVAQTPVPQTPTTATNASPSPGGPSS